MDRGQEFKFIDDELYVFTPMPQYGEHIGTSNLVMSKEVFQECYKRWIEPQESEDKE